jgi:hypothetical protein
LDHLDAASKVISDLCAQIGAGDLGSFNRCFKVSLGIIAEERVELARSNTPRHKTYPLTDTSPLILAQ